MGCAHARAAVYGERERYAGGTSALLALVQHVIILGSSYQFREGAQLLFAHQAVGHYYSSVGTKQGARFVDEERGNGAVEAAHSDMGDGVGVQGTVVVNERVHCMYDDIFVEKRVQDLLVCSFHFGCTYLMSAHERCVLNLFFALKSHTLVHSVPEQNNNGTRRNKQNEQSDNGIRDCVKRTLVWQASVLLLCPVRWQRNDTCQEQPM